MSLETVSQFIVPQKEPEFNLVESFESASDSAFSASTVSDASTSQASASDIDISELDTQQLEAALEAVRESDTRPIGASVIDAIVNFFVAVVSLIKYIFRTLSDGIGINEFQFGYIILGLGALFMTLPLFGEPRMIQGPLRRNSRIATTYMPRNNTNSKA